MKRIALLTNLLKWLFAAVGAIILYYVGYNVYQFFKSATIDGAKTKVKEVVGEVFKPTVYHPDKSKPQTWFQKNIPNGAEAIDIIKSWFGSFGK